MDYKNLTEKLTESLKAVYCKPPITDYEFFFQGEHKLLNCLYTCGQPFKKPMEMCRELNMTSARVSAALKILEKKGYIRREHSESDKRNVMVFLTDEGTEYIEHARNEVFCSIENTLRDMGGNAGEFVRLVARAAEIIEETERDDQK